jgi:hypothetical protein
MESEEEHRKRDRYCTLVAVLEIWRAAPGKFETWPAAPGNRERIVRFGERRDWSAKFVGQPALFISVILLLAAVFRLPS